MRNNFMYIVAWYCYYCYYFHHYWGNVRVKSNIAALKWVNRGRDGNKNNNITDWVRRHDKNVMNAEILSQNCIKGVEEGKIQEKVFWEAAKMTILQMTTHSKNLWAGNEIEKRHVTIFTSKFFIRMMIEKNEGNAVIFFPPPKLSKFSIIW